MHEVVTTLIEELAYARIRQRALLDVLADGYSPEKYYARFVELYRRDYRPLLYRSFITADAFAKHFGDWLRDDDAYYGSLWGTTGPEKADD